MKQQRNELCTCGSGLKFKKCCYIKGSANIAQAERLLACKQSVITRLIEFATSRLGENAIQQAWGDFHEGLNENVFSTDEALNDLFLPWFLFNWQEAERAGCLAEIFVDHHRETLTDDELLVLKAAIRRPYSYGELIEVNPGISIRLFDLFQQVEYLIYDKSAARILKKGDLILYANMLPVFERISFLGIGPITIPLLLKDELLDLRGAILNKHQTETISDTLLLEEMPEIIGYYLDFYEEILADDEDFTPED
ncbi:MAG: SEC-C domain-containing protein [Oligoflexus sp.]